MKRRELLKIAPLLGVSAVVPTAMWANEEPDVACENTTTDIEGPYYTPNAPKKQVLTPSGASGTVLFLTGTIYYNDCQHPIKNAELDVWQADGNGDYDNSGFNFRGKFYTDDLGNYSIETILPAKYLNGAKYRPRHIHFKLKGGGSDQITTQLYFEGDTSIPDDPWASLPKAKNRIIPLTTDANGKMHGVFDVALDKDPIITFVSYNESIKNRITSIYPNPIVNEGHVDIHLKETAEVKLSVFDLNGKQVKLLINENLSSGKHHVGFNKLSAVGLNLNPGVYVIQLNINNSLRDAKRFVII